MRGSIRFLVAFALPIAFLAACEGGDPPPAEMEGTDTEAVGADAGAPDAAPQAMDEASPPDAFLANLAALCGRAFRGEAVLATSDDFDGEMVMHVRTCEEDEVRIPLHIGENRSRTWIITRTADGLRLKHDHRNEDGTDEDQTMYGGDTVEQGTPLRQSFPADEFTAASIDDTETNVWTITLEPGERLVYHLTRHDAPRATFEFDLTDEVEPPPAPWGYEGT